MPEDPTLSNPYFRFCQAVYRTLDAPVTWFRENVVLSNRKEYPYYHRRYNRVPTVDQCYSQDYVCIEEANTQFMRDRDVDRVMITLIKERFNNCILYEGTESLGKCKHLKDAYDEAGTNYFIKYGDLSWCEAAIECYMKQKHRMLWERRHGPVGTGMRPE